MPEEYIVKEGDYLVKIAKGYPNVSAEDIVAANKDVNYDSTIQPGQVLIIPTESKLGKNSEPNTSFKKTLDKDYYEHFEVKRDNTYVKSTYVSCKDSSHNRSKRKLKKIRISLFFDGTGNNRANTNYRIAHKDLLKKKKSADFEKAHMAISPIENLRYMFRTYDSYDNDFSNISRLEKYVGNHSSYHFNKPIYVEGIGTTNLEADNTRGMATGRNSIYATSSGIKAKTRKGLKGTIEAIDDFCRTEKEKTRLEIDLDVFGFSRGAAAARYFVYLVLNSNSTLSDQLGEKGYWVSSVKIKFVGLFDTVASYGALINSDASLHLGFKEKMPEKVVQLAAAEEYRSGFPLTNINSAGKKGVELFLPGSHSDIGGGYNDNEKEERRQLLDFIYLTTADWEKRIKEDKAQLNKLGWYKKSDFESYNSTNKELIASRTVKYKSYSYIPLQLMAEYACHAGVPIWKQGLNIKYSIPEDLKELKKVIDKHKSLHGNYGSRTSTLHHWHNNDADVLNKVRHDYFHFSARYGDSGGVYFPRIVGKIRKRKVK